MESASLVVPATTHRLRALRDAKVLSEAACDRAIEIAAEPPPIEAQSSFASRAALILGGLLCLASVVFFVAHNWAGMSRWAKFGILELGLVAFAAAAWAAKGQLTRQLSLSLCAAMIGPLLAVYGQTYQTGADPYELFLSWALLAAPVAALSRFVPLWIGVWALLNLSLVLGCEQLRPFGWDPERYAAVTMTVLNLVGLGAYELISRRRSNWLGARAHWPARVLAAAALLPPLPFAFWYICKVHWFSDGRWGPLALAAVTLCAVVFTLGYRRDRFMKSTVAFGAVGLISAGGLRLLEDWLDRGEWGWLVLGLAVVLQVTIAASWIRRTGEVAR